MINGKEPISSTDFNKGLVTRSDFLKGDINASPNTMDVQWRFDASLQKRYGHSSTNSLIIGSTSVAGWTLDTGTSLNTNLISYWKLDETAGTRKDQFSTNNLSDNNSVSSIVGIRNNAALMVNTNSNSLLGPFNSALQTGNIDFSLSTWVYLNSTSTTLNRAIISKRDPNIDTATVLLLHMNGADGSTTFTDSSPSVHTVTANGNAQIDTAQSKYGGGSGLFDGTGDYLTTDDTSDFDLGTGDFTIDFWVRSSNWSGQVYRLFSIGSFASSGIALIKTASNTLDLYINSASPVYGPSWTPSNDTWYQIAIVRMMGTIKVFIDGVQLGSSVSDNTNLSTTDGVYISAWSGATSESFNGWMDEFRITKGIARWTSNFTVPTKEYGVNEFEYYLFVNSSNQASFQVSLGGSNATATVSASSIGALNTSTWYNVVAWHATSSHIGISVNLSVNTTLYTSGVTAGSAPLVLGATSDSLTANANNYLNARQDETGFWKKVLSSGDRSNLYGGGTGNTYSSGASGFSWASFDFGAGSLRWLTVSAGTGIYASSNLGTTFVSIATSRTQNYQSLTRSKNVLIATSDSYDVPLYWAGSAGTFASTLAPNSAPLAKFAVNYQGFLALLNFTNSNGVIRNRGFAYADENLQLTDAWTSSFDIPSSADDEITSAFILYKFLYISTRYTIYRVAFVGGNPDWSYLKVKDWGFVPRTVQIVSLKGGGQVAIGMDWDRRLRAFDGFDDMFVSDNIENDNKICDFAMQKISYAGSGLVISHAALNPVTQEYRLNVAIGQDSIQTTHSILLNARNLAFYPYSNQPFQTMCVAESNNQRHLMAFDRSGFCYILDSGNLDVSVAINESYDSPPLFNKLPEAVTKGNQINFFFTPESSGTLYFQDRFNLSDSWSEMRPLADQYGVSVMTGTENSIKLQRSIDIKSTYNTYQFRLTSSAGTANPWKMDRLDLLQHGFGIGQG